MAFADQFISGYTAGQQTKQRKQQQDWEVEDRDIEKQLLQHRMKELKIQERLRARTAAKENLDLMQGIPEADVTPEQVEGGMQGRLNMMERGEPTRLNPMEIPGIEEYGIPGVKRRPQTMEQQLAELLAQAQIKESTEVRSVPRGGKLIQGGRVIAEGSPVSEPLQTVTERDASGRETTRYVPRAEAQEMTSVRERLPQRQSTSTSAASPADIEEFVTGVVRGDTPPDQIPVSALGVRIRGELARRGYNLTRAQSDLKALTSHYQTLNTGERANLRIAADTVESALDELERVNEGWQSGGLGILSSARLAAAKLGGLGGDARQMAADFEAAVGEVRSALALLKSGGSAPTNKALEDAEKAISTGSNIGAAITRLRTALQYRTAAVRNLDAITPSSVEGAADFEWDPATGQLVPAQQ